jgi:hypothetical protein
MEADIHCSKTYNRSLVFFSRTRQKEVVLGLEQQFYNVITIYNRDVESRLQLRHKMEDIGNQIYSSIAHYYFEDDFLDYLFSLASFIVNYMQEIEERLGLVAGEVQLNQKFLDQEHPNFH